MAKKAAKSTKASPSKSTKPVKPTCPYCKSRKTQKRGMQITVGFGKRQRWMCSECGHTFYADGIAKKRED